MAVEEQVPIIIEALFSIALLLGRTCFYGRMGSTSMQVSFKAGILLALVAVASCSAGGANVAAPQTGASSLGTASVGLTAAAESASTASASSETLIDAGGGATANWSADIDYSGGWISSVSNAINTGLVSNPAPQAVYQSQRMGAALTYAVPNLTPNGAYTVRLHFVESWFSGQGQRLFNVSLNGAQVLSNFDIYRAANGKNIAIVEAFNKNADASGKISIQFNATANNASIAGIEITGGTSSPTPVPLPAPTSVAATSSCAPTATNPIFSGCFSGNSPYHHTVASLIAAGATVHSDATARNFWNNGNPLSSENIRSDGTSASIMWESAASDPQYSVTCPAYGTCDAATSVTGLKLNIPSGAAPGTGSDHHIYIFDPSKGQEVDMWGGFASNEACQVGTEIAGVLTCSWGGNFPLSGNGLARVAGNSGIAGGVAYGLAAITAGDILSGRITHALGLISPCLDGNGQYPAQQGRTSDSTCAGNAVGGRSGAEPTLRYGDMLHLKSSVNLSAYPYSGYTQYCKVVVKALQEYGAYADDTSSGYGLQLILLDQTNPGWRTIMASMIAGGDASNTPTFAGWPSCLNRIQAGDLETVTLNQGGNGALP